MLESLRLFVHPRVITMLFLGFSAGVPILLIFSTLGLWLNEAGVAKSTITYFSWAALGYSFKFVWAPLVDRLPLPVLTKTLGRRRAWMLVSQFAIMGAILLMASVDPKAGIDGLTLMAYGAVLLGFSSATQDIVIDAYRIESADKDMQSMLSATYIAGYRIGMLVAGAGGLFIASYLGSTKALYSYDAWSGTYMIMAAVMLIGVATTLIINEPDTKRKEAEYSTTDYARFFFLFLSIVAAFILTFNATAGLVKDAKEALTEIFANKHLAGFIVGTARMIIALVGAYVVARALIALNIVNRSMVNNTYVDPVKDFFSRYGMSVAVLLLAVIGLYRVSDIVLGVVANIFYQDMGFTKVEIATISKTFGLFMTITGGFLGGLMAIRVGVFKVLFLGAFLSALTNLLFIVLANVGHDIVWLYVTITMDNLSAGLAGAAFIAFLSSLTNIKFTAVQYAIFSSLMTLLPKIFGGYSGTLVEQFGYSEFFVITTLIGIPVLWLVYKVKPYIDIQQREDIPLITNKESQFDGEPHNPDIIKVDSHTSKMQKVLNSMPTLKWLLLISVLIQLVSPWIFYWIGSSSSSVASVVGIPAILDQFLFSVIVLVMLFVPLILSFLVRFFIVRHRLNVIIAWIVLLALFIIPVGMISILKGGGMPSYINIVFLIAAFKILRN